MNKLVHVIAVAHRRLPELRVFIQSWINQTSSNWDFPIIHDGESEEFIHLMNESNYQHPSIRFFCTDKRYNDYGHSLREIGLKQATGTYTLPTNCDNYFMPKTIEYIETAVNNIQAQISEIPDIILFDMVHAHPILDSNGNEIRDQYGIPKNYRYFKVEFRKFSIDVSLAIVKTEIAKKAGFKDKTFNGDQTYFQNISDNCNGSLSIAKLDNVLLVHN